MSDDYAGAGVPSFGPPETLEDKIEEIIRLDTINGIRSRYTAQKIQALAELCRQRAITEAVDNAVENEYGDVLVDGRAFAYAAHLLARLRAITGEPT